MQTKIHVDGMTCHHCEMSITNAVSAIAGVSQAEANLQNGTVTVTHDESASMKMIIAKIEEIGFEARV